MPKNKSKKKPKSIFDDRRITFFFALALALLAWVIIAGFINPGEKVDIDKITINYKTGESQYRNQDLLIVNHYVTAAKVSVSGNGSTILDLTNTDIAVYPDYSQVNGPGIYELPLKWDRIAAGNYDVASISPKTVTLQFERMTKKTLQVTTATDGIEAQGGYFKDTPEASPSVVEVSGPESEVEKITQAVAIVQERESRDKSKIYAGATIMLLDKDGKQVTGDLITITPDAVEVNVPILEVREIPVKIDFIGTPPGFDEDWLRGLMTLSTDTIRVAGEPELLNNFTEYVVGPIDVSTLEIDGEISPFNVTLPDRIKNQDELKQITVTFDTSGLEQRTFMVPNIQVVNQPAGLVVTPVEDVVYNVTLVGPAEVLENLLPENIVAQVDAFGVTAAQGGQQTIPARIMVPSSGQVFAFGSKTIVCDVTPE